MGYGFKRTFRGRVKRLVMYMRHRPKLLAGLGVLLFVVVAGGVAGTLKMLEPEPLAPVAVKHVVKKETSAPPAPKVEPPKPEVASAATPLPFDMPANTALKASSKKVFAHYFTPYPISADNKPAEQDYYSVHYLTPNGEGGKHAAFGGFIRQRPLPRPVDPSGSWQFNDMKTEVKRATEAGLDGFTVDLLGLPGGQHWTRLQLLLQAAPQVDPQFKIVLMPDSNGVVVRDPGELASAIASVAKDPATFKLPDGRLVVSPFYPEKLGAAWWQNWLAIMKNQHGIDVAFVPVFLDYQANAAAFAPFSHGFSNWGSRNPRFNGNLPALAADAHAKGKIWMQPVSVQDARPNQGIFDEANNTENLRITWDAATKGADWVQIPTWNDYSEGAEIAPSTHTGWGPLDISSYYLTKYKTGGEPVIKRDVVYVSHRVQPAGAMPTGGQPKVMSLRSGSSPARDTVEVLSFLAGPAKVEVKVGGNTYMYDAPAGVFSQTYPLAVGTVSAKVTRAGVVTAAVTSPHAISATRAVQDLQYHFAVSSRDGKP